MTDGFSLPGQGREQQKPTESENNTAEQVARAERFQKILANSETMRVLYEQLSAPGGDIHDPLIRDTIQAIHKNQRQLLSGDNPTTEIIPLSQKPPDSLGRAAA